MTYRFPDLPSLYAQVPYDVSARDAFGRTKVSNPTTIFDSKQIFDNAPLFFDDQQTSGAGTSSTWSQNRASTVLGVSATTAGQRVRQTFRRFNYQPGKAQSIFCTFVLGAGASGITKRVGYFDANNGLYLQLEGSTLSVNVRSNVTGTPVNTSITQTNWNIDPLDGTGKTGLTLDTTKAQILYIDFEWLGVGTVRFGFVINGLLIFVHQIENANVLASVYMSTPNLPIRYEITNDGTGGASTLECICCSVQSDGGQEPLGTTRSIDRGVTAFSTTNSTNVFPIISIRLKSGSLGATIIPVALSVLIPSNANFLVSLRLNPTIAGVDAVSWTSVANSSVEYDVSRNNTNTITGGTVLASFYGTDSLDQLSSAIDLSLLIGSNIAGTRDQLVVCVQLTTGAVESVYASLIYRELI